MALRNWPVRHIAGLWLAIAVVYSMVFIFGYTERPRADPSVGPLTATMPRVLDSASAAAGQVPTGSGPPHQTPGSWLLVASVAGFAVPVLIATLMTITWWSTRNDGRTP